ncbi:MAG: ATP-binding cassette domain-containing protein [Bryobacterales bacterium]
MLYQPVKRLNGIYNIFQQAIGSSERVFEYLSHPHDVKEEPGAQPLAPFAHSVVFENVGFAYPEHEHEPTLEGVNLTVNAGEVVAIVGPSGAGKSTLLNLLPRFFDATSGRILIDGRDVREASLKSLRDQIAIVTQETFLFDDTVRNNIAYGRPDVPLEAVQRAAASAIADEFIEAMPEGYQTHLGERGQRLSGGQKQRIAIARALLKDAPILLLDEATSHLDSEAEMLVQQALANLMQGRTVIVVAHRLSTIRSADKIVVLSDGRVADIGPHDRLLEGARSTVGCLSCNRWMASRPASRCGPSSSPPIPSAACSRSQSPPRHSASPATRHLPGMECRPSGRSRKSSPPR